MPVVKKSRTLLMKDFFGLKQAQTTQQFASEIKALSEEERQWFGREIARVRGLTQEEVDFSLTDAVAA